VEDEQRLPYIRAIIKEVSCENLKVLFLATDKSAVSPGVALPLAILDTVSTLFD
jgi:hypothetical protein